jgi:surface protein
MFTGCLKLSEINISSFDFKNIQNVDGMFSFCMGMKKLKIKKELLCTIKKEIHNNVQIIYS